MLRSKAQAMIGMLAAALAITAVMGFAGSASAQSAVNPVPVKIVFVDSPWVYSNSQTINYRLVVFSGFKYETDVQVYINPYVQSSKTGMPIGGPLKWYVRTYHLLAGQQKPIQFKVTTPPASPHGFFDNWCLNAVVRVEGVGDQSAQSCAKPDTLK